jgi:coatomer subunit beta'
VSVVVWGVALVVITSCRYAVKENSSKVKIFKNFKEKRTFKPVFGAEGIYGGALLGIRAANSLSFYDWDSSELIRRIEIQVKQVSHP